MGVVDALIRVRGARSSEVARIADALRADPLGGAAPLVRWLARLPERIDSPDARLAALETLRGEWIPIVERGVESLRNAPIPFDAGGLAVAHRTARTLRALRDAHVRIHAELRADRPDAPPTPRALLALARALDAQSRLLVAACRLRIALPREDWDELCRLAFPLCAVSALDQAFTDPWAVTHGRRSGTPREAVVTPLLMRLLEPLGLPGAGLALAPILARRAARVTGLRIDVDGLPHVCAEGPAMMLSTHHTVRLDTREAIARSRDMRARLDGQASPASVGIPTTLTAGATAALLERIESCWAPYHVPTPLVRAPVPNALMHVGLPSRPRPVLRQGRAPSPLAPDDTRPGGSPYVYGRAAGGRVGPRPHAPLDEPSAGGPEPSGPAVALARDAAARALMTALGAPVVWRGQDARRAVFARTAATPRLRLGQLVAVLPVRAIDRSRGRAAARPGAGPNRLHVGRVVSLAQTGVADGREPCAHDVGVAFWPGTPSPVRVRLGDTSAFEDAWWFESPCAGEPPSLLLGRDRFESATVATVRAHQRDVDLRVVRLIERGADFDRVEVGPIG